MMERDLELCTACGSMVAPGFMRAHQALHDQLHDADQRSRDNDQRLGSLGEEAQQAEQRARDLRDELDLTRLIMERVIRYVTERIRWADTTNVAWTAKWLSAFTKKHPKG